MTGRQLMERLVNELLFGPGGSRPPGSGSDDYGTCQFPGGELRWQGSRVEFMFYGGEPGLVQLRRSLVALVALGIAETFAGQERKP